MKPIARLGDLHSCPKKGHGTTPIVSVASDSEVDGQRVATVGDKTGCGATIVQGSSTMDMNGKPIAYVGCKTSQTGLHSVPGGYRIRCYRLDRCYYGLYLA